MSAAYLVVVALGFWWPSVHHHLIYLDGRPSHEGSVVLPDKRMSEYRGAGCRRAAVQYPQIREGIVWWRGWV